MKPEKLTRVRALQWVDEIFDSPTGARSVVTMHAVAALMEDHAARMEPVKQILCPHPNCGPFHYDPAHPEWVHGGVAKPQPDLCGGKGEQCALFSRDE